MRLVSARKAILLIVVIGSAAAGFMIWNHSSDPLSDFGGATLSRGDTVGIDFGGAQAHLTTITVSGLTEEQVKTKLASRGLRREAPKATIVSTPTATFFFSGGSRVSHEWYVDPSGRLAVLVEPSYPGGPIKLTKYTDLNYLEHLAFQLGIVKLHRLWTPYDSYSDLSRRQPSPPW